MEAGVRENDEAIQYYLNELNLSLQGKGLFIYDMYTNVISFKTKLKLFSQQFQKKFLIHFPTLKQRENNLQNSDYKNSR